MRARLSSRWILAVAAALFPSPAAAQGLQALDVDSAVALLEEWSAAVHRGDARETWRLASPSFRGRITPALWNAWVERHRPQWDGVGAGRVTRVETLTGAPGTDVTWVTIAKLDPRARGGAVFERAWAVRNGASPWRVAEYGAWPDPAAIVTNAYFAPVPFTWYPSSPYGLVALEGGFPGRHPGTPAGAERSVGRAVANPTTFPRRPPSP